MGEEDRQAKIFRDLIKQHEQRIQMNEITLKHNLDEGVKKLLLAENEDLRTKIERERKHLKDHLERS